MDLPGDFRGIWQRSYMNEFADFMNTYSLKGQHTPDRSMTRYRHDIGKMVENNEISTGPGRYVLGVPNAYGNAVFAPNPTVRMQKWGAAHDMSSTKTDVESDLLNFGRPTVRTTCGQYNPDTVVQRNLTAMPEADFPKTFERIIDPPCTLRDSGWNRWEWLCQNPQEGVMMPFEWNVDSRYAAKDGFLNKLAPTLATSQTARDHQFLCTELYVEPAVPVARRPGSTDAPNFVNSMTGPGTYPSNIPPPAKFTPRGSAPQGPGNPLGPPRDPLQIPLGIAAERKRAETGIMEPPPPFSMFIARV